jgi:hypothetical protein
MIFYFLSVKAKITHLAQQVDFSRPKTYWNLVYSNIAGRGVVRAIAPKFVDIANF